MRTALTFALLALAAPAAAMAQEQSAPPEVSLIDYSGFVGLTEEVQSYREARLIGAKEFTRRANSSSTLILDTRSAAAFAAGHIKGAVNLPFSDFTDEKLRKVIGDDLNREILIYCNNNFTNNASPFPLKRAPLALNIPTFINLYGYGYRNIYELDGAYDLHDGEFAWAGEIRDPLAFRLTPVPEPVRAE